MGRWTVGEGGNVRSTLKGRTYYGVHMSLKAHRLEAKPPVLWCWETRPLGGLCPLKWINLCMAERLVGVALL